MLEKIYEKYRPRSFFGSTFATRPPGVGLTSYERDALFAWQLGGNDFERLDSDSLLQARICGTRSHAKRVLAACHGSGIIDAVTGLPATGRIERGMVHQLAMLGVARQRLLVHMLFFWEEELVRWRLLCGEEAELLQRLTIPELRDGERRAADQQLRIVRARKGVAPSLRDESGRVREEELPGYCA